MAQTAFQLPKDLDAFVEEQVRLGRYRDRDAVIARAVERLQVESEDEEAKAANLRDVLKPSIIRLERGEGERVNDIGAYLDGIEAEAYRS